MRPFAPWYCSSTPSPSTSGRASRAEVFATLEAPALQALPDAPYEYAQWKRAKIHPNYHVEIDRHYYSVPYPLVGKTVDVRTSNATVEIFHRGKRVACHRSAIWSQTVVGVMAPYCRPIT